MRATLKNTKCGCDDRTLEEICGDVLQVIRISHRTKTPLLFVDLAKKHGYHTAMQAMWKLADDGYDLLTGKKKA